MVMKKQLYTLILANGEGWQIAATEKVDLWLKRLSRIMELKMRELNGYPKIIFTRTNEARKTLQELIGEIDIDLGYNLPISGWEAYDLRPLQFWYHSKTEDIICELGQEQSYELDIIKMWLSLHPLYRRVLEGGGFSLHSGLIEKDGAGILLAASGSTGKSTCCKRIPPPWKVLADDETLIVLNGGKQYMAHPFPTWSDYTWRHSERTWNVERHIPVSAIFFLRQAKTDEIYPIGQGQAAIYINELARQMCSRSWKNPGHEEQKTIKKKLFDNACEFTKAIPAFIFHVSLTGRFWEKIEEVLRDVR